MTKICVWSGRDGHYWDSAEDSGGFDRVSPVGPFGSDTETVADALLVFGHNVTVPALPACEDREAGEVFVTIAGIGFVDGRPDYYAARLLH